MDSHHEIRTPGTTGNDPGLAAVKSVFERIASAGLLEGIEKLLEICHEDVELSAYAQTAATGAAHSDLLIGRDAVRAFFRDTVERGVVLQIRPRRFTAQDDTVAVGGSIRVTRPDGSFAETGVRWNFHFRDGLVDEVGWEPSAGG